MKRVSLLFLSLLVLSGTLSTFAQDRAAAETVYFAMEMNDSLVGYHEIDIYPGEPGGKPRVETSWMVIKLKALGQDFDVKVNARQEKDAATGRPLLLVSDIERGDQELHLSFKFEGNQVHIKPMAGGQQRTVTIDDDVMLEESLDFAFLVKDFGGGEIKAKTYKVFNYVKGEVHEKDYTLVGEDTLKLLNKDRDCLVFTTLDRGMGISGKLWVEKATGRAVRAESSVGINSYLADSTVKMMIVRGDMDEKILGKVDVAIADIQGISYMKVRARIRTVGEWVTPESLNVPGQKFEGTVEDNLIDGVFTIEHERYDGSGAPPFPCDYSGNEDMKEYLESEDMVEVDDPVLVAKARELTEGASDSWDAACRLSRWVAGNIGYEIPGGSARYTYDQRKGECASHSRLLTAFCRGVGIPARMVSGGMYTPIQGGSFGQHVWNEIYMGDAGWITVDSTAQEPDFVDSGHIRLGNETGFNPEEIEILDFKAGDMEMGTKLAGLGPLGDVPFEVGNEYTYRFSYNGKELGTEVLTIKSHDRTISTGVYSCTGKISFPGGLEAVTEYKLDESGYPLSFNAKGNARGTEITVDVAFSDCKVDLKIVQGGNPVEKTVEIDDKVYLISNNSVSLLAFLAFTMPREEGQVASFKVFHPSSMQVLPGQVTVKGAESIDWNGNKVECSVLDLSLAGTPLKMYVDERGVLLRQTEQGGAVVIDLMGE